MVQCCCWRRWASGGWNRCRWSRCKASGQRPTIILDPGHGGVDGGAQANGRQRKGGQPRYFAAVAGPVVGAGISCYNDQGGRPLDPRRGNHPDQPAKALDLYNRLAIIEDHPEAIFVSIHQNKFEQASSRGAQIFFSPNNPESQKLAQSIQETFVSLLQPENTRQIKQAENNLFLLYEAQIPAVMAECGFLSNPQEASLLQDQTYQQQVAFTIFCGLMDYLAAE